MHFDDGEVDDDDQRFYLPRPRDLQLDPLYLFLEGVIRIGTMLSGILFPLREPLRHHRRSSAVRVRRSIDGRLRDLSACKNRNRCNE